MDSKGNFGFRLYLILKLVFVSVRGKFEELEVFWMVLQAVNNFVRIGAGHSNLVHIVIHS